jgi:hypothetical protein
MSRKPRLPTITCEHCKAPIIILRVGKKYRPCDVKAVSVVTMNIDNPIVVGYPRHVCKGKVKGRKGLKAEKVASTPVSGQPSNLNHPSQNIANAGSPLTTGAEQD